MAPLSKQLSEIIVKHDHFVSHLDNQGKTVDSELELRNFEHAGKLLAEIWSEIVIDNYDVIAEYKDNTKVISGPHAVDPIWYYKHVRESQ